MRFDPVLAMSAVDTTTSSTSSAIDASNLFAVSAQAVIVTAGTGTVKLQASNDMPQQGNPTSWSDIPSASVATTGAGTYLIPKTELAYKWIRVTYTATSGTGTITVRLLALGL